MAVAAILIGLALVVNRQTVAGLDWPCEVDFFRDMGIAQSMLDGHAGEDPAYLDELNWYNPLQPAFFAGLSRLTGTSLHVLYAQAGPWVNLLGPIGFFVLAAELFGSWPAVAALAAYLFLGRPDVPSWFQATYSAWAWPLNFAQGFFYLTLAAYVRAATSRRYVWDVVAGLLLGLTFLAHTAPALVFVFLLTVLSVFGPRRELGLTWRRYATIGVLSLLISLPFLGPLAVRYHLHVVNPLIEQFETIHLRGVLGWMVSARTALAAAGLWLLWRRRDTAAGGEDLMPADASDGEMRRRRLVAAVFFLATGTLLAYGLLAQGLFHRGVASLPRILPNYHFHLYFKAAEALLAGFALAALPALVRGLVPPPRTAARNPAPALGVALLALLIALHLPGYLQSVDHVKFRQEAERIGAEQERIALYQWLLEHTKPTDVVLAPQRPAHWAIAAADRKVISLGDQYSNIYVDYHRRLQDMELMYGALREGNYEGFASIASHYHIGYVLLVHNGELSDVPKDSLSAEHFTLVYSNDGYDMFRVH